MVYNLHSMVKLILFLNLMEDLVLFLVMEFYLLHELTEKLFLVKIALLVLKMVLVNDLLQMTNFLEVKFGTSDHR